MTTKEGTTGARGVLEMFDISREAANTYVGKYRNDGVEAILLKNRVATQDTYMDRKISENIALDIFNASTSREDLNRRLHVSYANTRAAAAHNLAKRGLYDS